MERDRIIDTIKYILILFVVIGHSLPKFIGGKKLFTHLMSGIYLFHMPLFVMISGYLTHKPPILKINESTLSFFDSLLIRID